VNSEHKAHNVYRYYVTNHEVDSEVV